MVYEKPTEYFAVQYAVKQAYFGNEIYYQFESVMEFHNTKLLCL